MSMMVDSNGDQHYSLDTEVVQQVQKSCNDLIKSIYLKSSLICYSQMEPKVDTSGQTIILGVESEEED